jgi:hypothetical protein
MDVRIFSPWFFADNSQAVESMVSRRESDQDFDSTPSDNDDKIELDLLALREG